MTEERMWDAVRFCDHRFDGLFYYAVKSTGIFCRPSCKSKTPMRRNVEYFSNAAGAERAGYRPCKRCRPDLGHRFDPDKELVIAACRLVKSEYCNPAVIEELQVRLGVSSFHLRRIFKKVIGLTLNTYLQLVRVDQAKRKLINEKNAANDICFAVGFTSFSNFYSVFRAKAGCSPQDYKKRRGLVQGYGDDI